MFANKSSIKREFLSKRRYREETSFYMNRVCFKLKQKGSSRSGFTYSFDHRKNGPAKINIDFKIYQWYKLDKKHRIDGPAHIEINDERNIFWYFNDIGTSEDHYWNL